MAVQPDHEQGFVLTPRKIPSVDPDGRLPPYVGYGTVALGDCGVVAAVASMRSVRYARASVKVDATKVAPASRSGWVLSSYVCDFRDDVVAVTGKILGEVTELPRHAPASEAYAGEHENDDDQHRRDTADTPLQPRARRCQHKCQQEG
jgi:NADPH-dependent 2,4-dienoyl-CoA reductase/sulfur reductase-like enzyme